MNHFFVSLFLFWSVVGCAQSHIRSSKKVQGYIFPKEQHISLISFEDAKERFTPSDQEIAIVEQLITEQLIKVNQPLLNQASGCPIIHKNLGKYERQYVGYINAQGDKIIWVNFVWKKNEKILSGLKKDVIIVFDGCSHYWNIKVDISNKRLYDLQVNGVA